MSYLPESCIVKIALEEKGLAIAAGFLIGKKWILTCRHVIERNQISLEDTIYTTFYLDESEQCLKSHIHFLSSESEPDVAVLELEGDIPSSICPGKLQNLNNSWNRELKICGFSSGMGGEWVPVIERGKAGTYLIQIDVQGIGGYKIEEGFSGTPVFDTESNNIIGMVVAKETAEGVYSGVYIPISSIVELFEKHSIDIGIPESLCKPPAPTFFVPSLPTNYLPRQEDLDKIEELVMESEKKISAVQGMGGIGKSVLTAAFARTPQVLEVFNDGVFWITIGLKPDLIGNMRLIGTKLKDDSANYSSEVEAKDSLSKVLSDKKCLIILDDVWKVQHAEPFFNSLGASCKLLITTRNDDVITSLVAKKYEIKILSEDQALWLLAKWCEQEVDALPSEAAEVAKECGYLPLALSICGALAKSGRQWLHILKALKDANLKFIKAQMPDYFYDGVMASLEASVSFLNEDNPEVAPRYRELVIFPTDELIPEAAILTLWMDSGNLMDYEALDLLIELENKALLSIEQMGSERFVSLHDLQYDYLRDTTEDIKAIHEKLIDAYSKKCNGVWADGPDDKYFFNHLAYHLKEAGREEKLLDLLFDLNWMQAKLNNVLLLGDKPDVSALIHDYGHITNNTESDLVRDAIKLSAHVLTRDKNQLENQLLGRLLGFDSPKIKSLLEQAHESGKKHQKLLLIRSSLKAPGGPLIRTLTGHELSVTSVAITPDGKSAVSASEDWMLKIWDLEKGEEKATLAGHEGIVTSVAITPDGKSAVSASDDWTLKIWDLEKGEATATLTGHDSYVSSVAITPDGKYAVSASEDRKLKIWDLEKGEATATLTGHEDWVNSVAITSDNKYAVSTSYKVLKIWDLEKREEIATLKGHEDWVNSVAITSDNKYAVSTSYKVLKIWDLEKGEEKATLTGHEDWVNSVAITSDNKYAVSASDDRKLKIWDLEKREEIATLKGHDERIRSVAITPDGKYAVSASDDKTLNIWDIVNGQLLYTFIGDCSFLACTFSITCDYIVAGDSLGNVYFFSFFP